MNNMKRDFLLILTLFATLSCTKVTPEKRIETIYNYFDNENTTALSTLETVSNNYPARMSGSQNNSDAIDYFTLILGNDIKVDNIWYQDVTVPHWLPGENSVSCKLSDGTTHGITAVPVGLSVGTDGNDLTANIVEVTSREAFDKANVKGKIVLFNEPMTAENGYGKARWQRTQGAALAGAKGAVAVLVRSMTTLTNDDPHTGSTRYDSTGVQIPAMAISTQAADKLSEELKKDGRLKVTINSTAKRLEDTIGRNLVAEIVGKKTPEHIILLSAHLDSWFNSQGAQDNAASCVTAVEVLRAFKKLKIKPNNTIRILLYQDEECFLSGMKEYAKIAKEKNEEYLFDLEMDSGAGGPKSFRLAEKDIFFPKIKEITDQYLTPYGIEEITQVEERKGWPLSDSMKIPYYGYVSNTDHYFDIHHSSSDNFDKIDPAAFKKGIATVTAFVYLMD